jgi:NTE family protein
MVFGVNWHFCRDEVGDWQAGYSNDMGRWSIAEAVAASACFPPLFGPMSLGIAPDELKRGAYNGTNRDQLCRKLSLSDGGVYDNMALEPAWKTHEVVLVSDCGAPFRFTAGGTYLRRLMRYTSVVMNQAAATRKRWFFADISERKGGPPPKYKGGYWGIAGSVETYKAPDDPLVGYSQSLVDEVIDRVRTDLDRFTLPEMYVLENHGYLLTAAVLRRRRPELLQPNTPAAVPPHPEWMDEKKVRKALKDSGKRVSLNRLLGRSM